MSGSEEELGAEAELGGEEEVEEEEATSLSFGRSVCFVSHKKQCLSEHVQATSVDVTGAVFLLGGVTFVMSLFYLVWLVAVWVRSSSFV